MGEARRRKQLDPSWGKSNRQFNSENQGTEVVARVSNNHETMLLGLVTTTLTRGVLRPIDLSWR